MAKQAVNEEIKEKLKAAEGAIEQIKSRFGDGAILKFADRKPVVKPPWPSISWLRYKNWVALPPTWTRSTHLILITPKKSACALMSCLFHSLTPANRLWKSSKHSFAPMRLM